MHHTGTAILLHAKTHGENAAVVTLFSSELGKIRGLVRGGRKKRAELQVGNLGQFGWTRRLEHQLGTLTWENTATPAAPWLEKPKALAALQYLAEVLHTTLPEENPYPPLYVRTLALLDQLGQDDLSTHLAWWELHLLTALGYGLSLTKEKAVPCPQESPLTYVSPKTGRAVSALVGEPYKEKLLPLPYLFGGPEQPEPIDMAAAFRLTGYFLDQAVQGKPLQSRQYLLTQLTKGENNHV